MISAINQQMARTMEKHGESSVAHTSLTIVRVAVGFLLLSLYLLPNIGWLVPFGRIMDTFSHSGTIPGHLAVVFAAVAVTWFSYSKYVTGETSRQMLWGGLGIYLLAVMIGCFRQGPKVTVPALDTGTIILLSLCVGMLSVRLCARAETGIWVMTMVTCVQAVCALWLYMHPTSTSDASSMTGTLDNAQALGFLMGVCIPLTAVLVAAEKNSAKILFLALATAAMFAALLLTRNYEMISGIVMACAWIFAARLSRHRRAALIALALLNVSLLVIPSIKNGLMDRIPVAGATTVENAWRHGLQMSERHWQAGIGAGSSGDVIEVASGNTVTYIPTNPRNIVLQWISELGLGGGILFVMIAVSIAQLLRNADRRFAAGLGVAWLSILYAGLWDVLFGTASDTSDNALMGFLIGITLLCPRGAPEESRLEMPVSVVAQAERAS